MHFASDPLPLFLIPMLPKDILKHHIPLPDVIQKLTLFVYYSALFNTLTSIIHLPSQMARSFSGISTLSCDTNLYSVCVELHSLLLQGVSSLLASTSEAHWPASPNSCMSRCLIITPLVRVMSFNHIQISTSDMLSDPSSCWMVVGTPSGLCCHDVNTQTQTHTSIHTYA